MSSLLQTAAALLLPLTIAGCLAAPSDDAAEGSDEAIASVAQADDSTGTPTTTGTTTGTGTTTTCTNAPIGGPGGVALPGPYACAASASGITTPPGYGYYAGYPYYTTSGGYYPTHYGYSPWQAPNSFGYGASYYPTSYGYGSGYYPSYGFFGPSTPTASAGTNPCGCPTTPSP